MGIGVWTSPSFHHLPCSQQSAQETLLFPTPLAFQGQGSKVTWVSAKMQNRFSFFNLGMPFSASVPHDSLQQPLA